MTIWPILLNHNHPQSWLGGGTTCINYNAQIIILYICLYTESNHKNEWVKSSCL